jgi:hypothetical protein
MLEQGIVKRIHVHGTAPHPKVQLRTLKHGKFTDSIHTLIITR